MIKSAYSYVGFHVSKEGFEPSFGNYAIRKTLEVSKKLVLNTLIRKIYYFGLNDKLDQAIQLNNAQLKLEETIKLKERKRTWKQLDNFITQATVTFLWMYLNGIVISVFVFLLELLGFLR